MNLLVFRDTGGAVHFVLQRAEPSEPLPPSGGSWWIRIRSQVVAGYRRLRQHFAYQERMLGQLRHAEFLRIYHAASFEADQVERDLRELLRAGSARHTTWFVVDALVAGLGGILAPLPGPNIFFFYPAIRALGHYLARQGARHAGRLRLSFEEEPLIDRVEQMGPSDLGRVSEELQVLEERYSMDPLKELLGSEIYEH